MREYTVQFHSVNELAQPFPVHFDYQGSRLDAKSILSLCALPLEAPVRVVLPEQVSCERFLADIQSFLCDPAAE